MARAADGLPTVQVVGPLYRLGEELAEAFRGVFSRETVDRLVEETYDLLAAQASLTPHLLTLTARFARQRLIDHGRAAGLTRISVPQVLFLCVHNIGRSQLAAALLDHHAEGRVTVRSAGSRPQPHIPATITDALGEVGISLARAFPKPLTDEVLRAADVVVSMGCGEACPLYPGKRYLDWDIADPIDAPIATVRRIRDDIDHRVRDLLADLLDG
ncbi:MAG TPA: arsenate reductase ArsC [Actinophytocola sp.]|uniref:arsenate reductase ArsC n=1 Tax=Actinophytocola sp. TaxID=1872138 RepID=UPI002DBBF399|nr:arsenate reductase ArsC [Actinophytocola sp.]HEU5470641.1 arsenate reductase ArsC [Actinophytocola sp.]